MCRNIKILFNFEPPASDAEIRAAAEQYVRKISGFAKPSAANEESFKRAVDQVAKGVRCLAPLARDQRSAAESGGRSRQGSCSRTGEVRLRPGVKNADKILPRCARVRRRVGAFST